MENLFIILVIIMVTFLFVLFIMKKTDSDIKEFDKGLEESWRDMFK